jgi:uncharacterized protein
MRARVVGVTAGLAVVAGVLAAAPAVAAPDFPAARGRCVDATGVLGDALCAKVTAVLMRDEKATTDEIAVAVVATTDGESIEHYSTGLFNTWGVGKREKDNGVLLVVAVDDHRLRLETGRGMAARLDDAAARHIVDTVITPRFTDDRYPLGILAGLDAVRTKIGHTVPASARLVALAPSAPAGQDTSGPDGENAAVDQPPAVASEGAGGLPAFWCLLVPVGLVALLLAAALRPRGSRGATGAGAWGYGRRSVGSGDTTDTTTGNSSSFVSSGGGGSDFGGGASSGGGASGSW